MRSAGPRRIRKRDGAVVGFEPEKIRAAVAAAAREVGHTEPELAPRVTSDVCARLSHTFGTEAPGVEEVQDTVEQALMDSGLSDVARAYVVYRSRRAELREAKRLLGVRDELKLSLGGVAALEQRYLRRDLAGRVVESTAEMMERVASHVAAAEEAFPAGGSERWAAEFTRSMQALEFLPNSPTLMNAGTELGLLSACFVLPIEDSLRSIFTTLTDTALVHQAGAGTGFSFSRLRPAGDLVATTHGVASGPLSFLRVYDVTTDVVRQGGRRRGANMAVLDVSHPDIGDFVDAKTTPGVLENFNLSVAVDGRFMQR